MPDRLRRVRLPEAKHLMACLIGFFMLWELERKINFPGSSTIYHGIQIAELLMAGVMLAKLPLRENKWYWIPLAGVALIFLTSAVRPDPVLDNTDRYLLRAVPVYMLCPAVGMLMAGAPLKRFLKAFLGIWTVLYVALALGGIYCVMTGLRIRDYTNTFGLGFRKFRMELFDGNKVYTAINLMISILMALIGCAISEKRITKAAYLIGILPMMLCLIMTSGRGGLACALAGIALAVTCMLQKPLSRRIAKKWLRLIITVILILVIVGVGIIGDYLAQDAVNDVLTNRRNHSGLLISTAKAEEMSVKQYKIRTLRLQDFFRDDFLNSRDVIWSRGIQLLSEKPYLLLTGTSLPLMTEYLNPDHDETYFYHLHNMPFHILFSTGIVGLALCAVFLFLLFRAAGRLYLDTGRPLWERFVMIPAVCIVLHEMMDCVTMLDTRCSPANMLLMFFAGLTIVLGSRKREKDTERAHE